MFRRVFKYILVVFLLALPLVNVVSAQVQPNLFKKNREDTLKGSNQEAFLENATFHNVAQICQAVGAICDKDKVDIAAIVMSKGYPGLVSGGMVGMAGQLTSLAFVQPISGIEYLANAKDELFGKPAYAQAGNGYTGLGPILPIWRVFRNIVYMISSMLFVVLGLMIILRVKVNPQTVVSIQSAIPSVVSTLLLVTFSYAIAGLLIDLMTLLQAGVIAMIFTEAGKGLDQNLFPDRNQILNNIPFLNYLGIDLSIGSINLNGTNGDWWQKLLAGVDSFFKPFNFQQLNTNGFPMYMQMAKNLIPTTIMQSILAIIGALLVSVVLGLATGGPGALTGVPIFPIAFGILEIVFTVVILIYIIKLFFGLMKNYFYILFKIMIAPLEIATGAIPGSKGGFNTWFWDLLGNLMVFPIVLIVLVVSNYIIFTLSNTTGRLWAPNLLNLTVVADVFSVFPGAANLFITFAIGFGTLMLLSQFPTLIPQVIFSLKPSAWETAIGKEASGAITAPYRGFKNAQESIGVWSKNRAGRGGDNGKPTAKSSSEIRTAKASSASASTGGSSGGSGMSGTTGTASGDDEVPPGA